MPTQFHPDFIRAFTDGAIFHTDDEDTEWSFQNVVVHTKHIADLTLTTGHIVACDPFVFPKTSPFTITVDPGKYPVMLSIATVGSNHERVACAKAQFHTTIPERWEMALLPKQDPTKLAEDEVYGYPVDAGTGCFGDIDALAELDKRQSNDHNQRYFNEVYRVIEANQNQWADIGFLPETEANCVMFSSGWGDGFYTSWWGYDADGRVIALVTDFGILP